MPKYNIPPTPILDTDKAVGKAVDNTIEQPKRKRGRPKKIATVSYIEDSCVDNSVENVGNKVDNTEIVELTSTSKDENFPPTAENISPLFKKKSSPKDPNQICMACGKYIPDTPDKINLSMFLDAAPYKFNTVLNEKGRIILCHDCHDHLIAVVDKELKKMGCEQKFE